MYLYYYPFIHISAYYAIMILVKIIIIFTLLYHNDSIFYGLYVNVMILSSILLLLAYEDVIDVLHVITDFLHESLFILILFLDFRIKG